MRPRGHPGTRGDPTTMRNLAGFAACAAVPAFPAAAARAEGEGGDADAVKRRMEEMERRHEAEMKSRGDAIEKLRPTAGKGADDRVETLEDRVADLEKSLKAATRSKPDQKLINFSLDGLFAAGASTATDPQVLDLQGGGHDPHKRGFTAENIEL